ncbi:MAG TPA: hypothetical protein VM513_32320 [Kofleriaceae bacterium]|jgi:hypothetical protein|nr:hypothetical protein [Kofleriaceae bacterium]
MRALPLLLVALVACGDSAAGGSREAIIARWKEKGLTPSAMTAAKVDVGKDCQSGTVDKLDVLLCVYPTDAEAKAAEDAGLAWVGDTTGMAQAKGSVLIVVADRKKSDPSGRTINQMMK